MKFIGLLDGIPSGDLLQMSDCELQYVRLLELVDVLAFGLRTKKKPTGWSQTRRTPFPGTRRPGHPFVIVFYNAVHLQQREHQVLQFVQTPVDPSAAFPFQ